MFARPAFRLAAVATALLCASVSAAQADTIEFWGSRTGTDPVSFGGTMSVTSTSASSAQLKITLDNTTSSGDALTRGYITGFGFNLPTGILAANATTGAGTIFNFLTGASSQSTSLQPNSGEFDYAFSLHPTQLHTAGVLTTSQIQQGIAASTAPVTFTVNLSGTGAGALTAEQIIQELTGGSVPREFSVRFRSSDTSKYSGSYGDGDKVEISDWKKVEDTTKPKGVPAPPGLVLAGMGFGCVLLGRLRIRRSVPKA